MTLVAEPLAAARPDDVAVGQGRLARWATRSTLEHAAFAVVLLLWWLYVLPARAGWEPYVVPAATAVTLVCLLLLRPWRHCPRWMMAAAAAPAAGALLVAALAPFGDGSAISLARWGYFGAILLAAASYARSEQRRHACLIALMLVGLHQYSQGWLAWWGGGASVDGPMLGTVYSANPFGGLMLAFALLAATAAVLDRGRRSLVGWVVAPIAGCAVVLSGARAAMLLLAVGLVVLAAVGTRVCGVRGALRSAVVGALTVLVVLFSTSSLFFTGVDDALAATTAKSASGQTLESTSSVRVEYWKAAGGQFLDNPFVGGGAGSYVGDSRFRMPAAAERSPFAHNEVLGALAEGGLALGIPVLVVFLGGGLLGARALLAGVRVRRAEDNALVARATALAAGAVMAHAMVDFALSFPGILALLGILLGLTAAARPLTAEAPRLLPAAAAVLVLGLCGVYLGISHDRAGVGGIALRSVDPVTGEALVRPLPGVHDARLEIASARLAVASATDHRVAAALTGIEPLARLDGAVEALRVSLLAASGRRQEALVAAEALAEAAAPTSPLLTIPYAEQLASTGRDRQAFDLLAVQVYARSAERGRVASQLRELLAAAVELGGTPEPGWSCALSALKTTEQKLNPHWRPVDPSPGPLVCEQWAVRAGRGAGT